MPLIWLLEDHPAPQVHEESKARFNSWTLLLAPDCGWCLQGIQSSCSERSWDVSAWKAAEGQRPIVSLSQWHFFSSRNLAASWLKGHLSVGQGKILPLLWDPHSKGLISWCGYRGGGGHTSTGLVPSSKHYQERPDKSLLRRFVLKRWCLISLHRIPYGVIISTDVAPVVPTALTCTPPRWGENSCVWVSPAVGPERPDGSRNGLCSLIASSPHSITQSKALSCSTTLIYVLHTHVAATQPLSNSTAPCWLVTQRLVFRERWANFQHGDL